MRGLPGDPTVDIGGFSTDRQGWWGVQGAYMEVFMKSMLVYAGSRGFYMDFPERQTTSFLQIELSFAAI